MGQQQKEVMKLHEILEAKINWNALRQADAVMPYLYDSPELRARGEKPDRNNPNIITSVNLKEPKRPEDKLTPLTTMNPVAWQKYRDGAWIAIKQNAAKGDPDAKEKFNQIKKAASDAGLPISEGTRCWKGYEKKGMKTMFGKRVPNCVKREHIDFCVNCHDILLDESLDENLKKWFKDKWVRMGPGGKIRGSCGGKSKGEGKPKCLPARKAYALGKKGRASAARRKRRKDPNPNRRGKAINVATKKKKK